MPANTDWIEIARAVLAVLSLPLHGYSLLQAAINWWALWRLRANGSRRASVLIRLGNATFYLLFGIAAFVAASAGMALPPARPDEINRQVSSWMWLVLLIYSCCWGGCLEGLRRRIWAALIAKEQREVM